MNQRNRLLKFCVLALLALSSVGNPKLRAQTNILEASPAQLKKMSLEDLMKLDITSVSRRSMPFSEAPAAIQVITQEDIRRSGASSIPEALRLANNLQVAQIDSRSWAISARGFNSTTANKLLVMIDGRSVYTPLFSGVFWDVQDYLLEDLDRIEVISGPGATLYGANAVNGVINIISKSAKATQGVLLTGGGGTELRYFGGVRYGGMLTSNLAYRVYGKYFDRDASVFSPGTASYSGGGGKNNWNMGQGGFRLDWDASDENTVTFQGDYYDGEINQRVNDNITVDGGNLLSRWNHTISDESDFSLQLYLDRTRREIPGSITDDLDTYDLDFDHRFMLGERNNLTWGAGYRYTENRTGSSGAAVFLPAEFDRHLFTFFAQDKIRLRDDLFFTLGSKLEHNDYTGFEVQPSARLAWHVNEKNLLWSAVSRAVRTPSRVDTDLYLPGTAPFVLAGGPDFESETLIAYEIGYRAQLHSKVSVSVSTFFDDYDNIRSLRRTTTNAFPFVVANDVTGETYGVEVDVIYQPHESWRLRAGYVFLEEDLRVKSGRRDINNAVGEVSDPANQASLQSLLSLPGNLELDGRLRWVDRVPRTVNGVTRHIPSYFALDLRLGWMATENLEFSIVGQNLLDNRHPEFGFPDNNQQEIERSVYGKVTWKF